MRLPKSVPTWIVASWCMAACVKPSSNQIEGVFAEKPFLQSAINGCVEISSVYISPASRAGAEGGDAQSSAAGKVWPMEFRLRIAPAPACRDTMNFHASDVVYGQAHDQDGVDRAIKEFHQRMGTKIWLKAGDKRIRPRFHHVESILGLENSREVWVVFHLTGQERAEITKGRTFQMVADNVVPGHGVFVLTWPRKILESGV